MDERWLEIRDYKGAGFKPLVYFGAWRVAMLRSEANPRAETIKTMERHNDTDEVFVLMEGKAILLIGGDRQRLDGVFPQHMQAGKIYNVRRGVWHAVVLSPDASILIVENRDTSADNSQYLELTAGERGTILDIENRLADSTRA